MSTDELAKQLHYKTTRGSALSATEQAQLDTWYVTQDKAESLVLAAIASPQTLASLQGQVDTAVAQLLTATQRIQELVAQNDVLRCDIAALQRQLAQAQTVQPA